MSWVERLQNLNLPKTDKYVTVDSLYVDGSKFIKQPLLQEIARENPWISISNITFQRLYRRYNSDVEKVYSHLMNERCDAIIYENSNQNLLLLQTVQQFLLKYKSIDLKVLNNIFDTCCNLLQNSSTHKSILIIDCRYEYFDKHKQHANELYLQTFAQAALLKKRCLFPFMDIVIIKDRNVDCCDVDQQDFLLRIYEMLQANLYTTDTILYSFNNHVIKNRIINAHKSNGLLDLELS